MSQPTAHVPGSPASSAGESRLTRRSFVTTSLAALLAPSSLACSTDDLFGPVGGSARLSVRHRLPTLSHTVGESALELGGGRDGVLYVPAGYSPETAAPLFVALHGAGGRGGSWAGFYPAMDDRDMILLAPDSRAGTWDLFRGRYGPDIAFLDRALGHTFDRCRIDPSRIAFGGFSDGASYALSVGVANGDLFSHLIAFSPGIFRFGSATPRKPRVYVSHGRADPVLPFGNTRNTIVPRLEREGYDVRFDEFDGTHEVPEAIAAAALDWFLE